MYRFYVGINTVLNFIVVNATLARTTERVLDCTLKLEAGDHIERKLAAILKFRERERKRERERERISCVALILSLHIPVPT